MTGFLNTSDLDFDALKASLKDFLKSQPQFKDFNFEGSNLSVLIDLLTSNTQMLAYYLNMVGSESFLDTAQNRSSVVSHAKELNYVPRSSSSAVVNARIIVQPDDAPSQIFIPKYYEIATQYDNRTLKFILPNEAVIKNNAGNYVSDYMLFYEGEIVTEYFTGGQQYYPLTNDNIDHSSIEVWVDGIKFDRAENLFGLSKDSQIFFVEGYQDTKYQVVFGNDVLGVLPKFGQEIKVTYRISHGSLGNNISSFTAGGPVDGYSDVTVEIEAPSYGGAEPESIEEIKYNATRHFQLRARAVTTEDYATFVKEKFPQIQAVAAFGGEEAYPKQYGKVLIALKPYGSYTNITNKLKTSIASYLKGKNITIEPIIVDPEYLYIGITSEIQVDISKIASLEDVKAKVVSTLLDLNDTMLNNFGNDFRYSQVLKAIDESDKSVVSNDTHISIIKKWQPVSQQPYNMKFSYMNKLDNTRPEAVYSTTFNAYVNDVLMNDLYIRDDQNGKLQLAQRIDSSYKIVKADIGTVNYETGDIFFSLTVHDYENAIKIYARPANADIIVKNNMFLVIDNDDMNITVIQQKK